MAGEATQGLEAVLQVLADAGVTASRDAGSFVPRGVGVLVGLPSWVDSTLAGKVFEVPVLVVSGDPLNTAGAVDRLYAEADAIADALACDSYRPATWEGATPARPEGLPAVEIIATVTVPNEEV